MSRMIWVWDAGYCGALICVASDREEAMEKFAVEQPTWDLNQAGDAEDGIVKSYELDEVVVTRGYEP